MFDWATDRNKCVTQGSTMFVKPSRKTSVSSNPEAMFAVKDQYERRKATRFYGQQKAGDFRVAEVIISLCIRTTWGHLISVSNWNQSFNSHRRKIKKICEESIEKLLKETG